MPLVLPDPTHPRMRWERFRQWTFGEWAWMVIWKFADQVEEADVAYATRIAMHMQQSNYPSIDAVPSGYLLWLLEFTRKLIGQRLMSIEEAAKTDGIVELVERRQKLNRMMEQKRADDVLEGALGPLEAHAPGMR